MRKYIKPEINIETYNLSTSIANSVSYNGTMNQLNDYDNNAGSLDWSNLFE